MLTLTFAGMGVSGQTTPSTHTPLPPAAQEKPAPNASPTVEDTQNLDNTAIDVEIQRRFNNLRHQLLDDKADTINWWLNIILVVLGFFSVIAVFGGYFGFRRFREIEAEAKKYAEEARKGVEEINELNRRAGEAAQQIERERERITRASVLHDEPDRARQVEEASPEVTHMSPLDRAITEAFSLQRAGKREEAIEKWRSIADVTEGSAPDIAALAWLSIGFLLYEKEVEDAGEQ